MDPHPRSAENGQLSLSNKLFMRGGALAQSSALILPMIMLGGCLDLLGSPKRDQVAWANSPDGAVHAILLETNGGATTSYGYEVELHPAPHQNEKPSPAGRLYGATRSSCAYGVNIGWLSPDHLTLEYDQADRVAVPPKVDVAGRTITIETKSGVPDADAPCGGMAVNSN
jgi:hypothetical protein